MKFAALPILTHMARYHCAMPPPGIIDANFAVIYPKLPMAAVLRSSAARTQVVELPILHTGHERLDLSAGVDKGRSGGVP